MVNNDVALLVVDVQQAYVNRQQMPRTAEVAEAVEGLQARYQVVIITQNRGRGYGLGEGEPAPSPLAFQPAEGAHQFVKVTLSAATQALVACLKHHGINNVHLCGISTEACVMATAFALYDLNFNVHVLEKYCASNNNDDGDNGQRAHDHAIGILRLLGMTR